MAGAVYSHRFLLATGPAVDTGYTVPSGYRAVIRSVVAGASQAEAAYYYLFVNGQPMMYRVLPATPSCVVDNLRLVVYAGESFSVYTNRAWLAVAVTGYLFSDVMNEPGPPGKVTSRQLTLPELLPTKAPA